MCGERCILYIIYYILYTSVFCLFIRIFSYRLLKRVLEKNPNGRKVNGNGEGKGEGDKLELELELELPLIDS